MYLKCDAVDLRFKGLCVPGKTIPKNLSQFETLCSLCGLAFQIHSDRTPVKVQILNWKHLMFTLVSSNAI